MRRKFAFITVCAALAIVLPVRANEKPSEAYQKAEKDLNATTTQVRLNFKAIKWDDLQKNVADLRVEFGVMMDYWKQKGAEDAIKAIEAGIKAANDMDAAAKTMNYQAATEAMNALAGGNNLAFNGVGQESLPGVCVGCHLAHRQRMPDGTYEIK